MSLSIFIPVRNEEKTIKNTLNSIFLFLKKRKIEFEIIVVNDFSTDKTEEIVKKISQKNKKFIYIRNLEKGLGSAFQTALNCSSKKYFCIYMSDQSDSLKDLNKYYKIINKKNIDAVFGSRFIKGSKVTGYPFFKLLLNRVFNFIVKIIFLSNYNDFTNAFKIYNKKTLEKLRPIVSEDFNIFLELPLKIISRLYLYSVVPVSWNGRKKGKSKFMIKELRSKYVFTFLYCLIEKILIKKNK